MQIKVNPTFLKSFFSLCLPAVLITSTLHAQSLNSLAQNTQVTAKQIEDMQKELGVAESKKFKLSINPEDQSKVHPLLEASLGVPNGIIAHLKSTKGIPFSAPEPRMDFMPVIDAMTELEPDAKAEFLAAQQAYLKANTTIPKLKSCQASGTEAMPNAARVVPVDSKEMAFDMLFINEKDMPMDPKSFIGQKTLIMPYSTTKMSVAALAMGANMVPCLPYRIRLTNKNFYKDQGLNALMNYDADPDRPGVLKEEMKNKFLKSSDFEM